MANVYARMGEGELALENLNLIARSCIMNNFLTVHNDWRGSGITLNETEAPFQIDGQTWGGTAAIQEMLTYSTDDIIRIPARTSKRMG